MSDDVKVDEQPAVCVCNVRPEGNTELDDCDSEMIRKTFEVLLPENTKDPKSSKKRR